MRLRLAFAFLLTLFGIGGLSFAVGSGSFAVAGTTPPKAPPASVKDFREKAEFVERSASVKRGARSAIEATGWVSVTHYDDDQKASTATPDDRLMLNSANGRRFILKVPKSAKVTSTATSSAPEPATMIAGDVVSVTGTSSGNTITVASAAVTTTLPDPRLNPSQTQRPVENRRVLTVLATWPEQRAAGTTEPFPPSDAETAMFNEGLGDISIRNYFKQVSRSRFMLDGDVTDWLPVTTPIGADCDQDAWMDAALAAVRTQGTYDPDTYDYLHLVMPNPGICGYSGVSFGPRLTLAFTGTSTSSVFPDGTTIHELGHAVGLDAGPGQGHAGSEVCTARGVAVPMSSSCVGSRTAESPYEYRDRDDVMGTSSGKRTFNAAHRAHLGFLPLANVKTIDPDGEERTLTRSNEELGSTTQLIEVRRPKDDALHAATQYTPDTYVGYALELRGATSPFESYPAGHAAGNRVAVHLTGRVADDRKGRDSTTSWIQPSPGKSYPGPRYVTELGFDYNAGLAAGQSLYDPLEKYTITVGEVTATTAKVTVAPGGPPGGAAAATNVAITSGTLTATAKTGRRNVLSVVIDDGRYLISDFGNPVTAGAGCEVVDPVTVGCTILGVRALSLVLGDGDDVASVHDAVKVPTSFNGGAGNDTLEGSAGADDTFVSPTLDGADVMLGYGGTDTLTYTGRAAGVTITGSTLVTTIGQTDEGDRAEGIENYSGTALADTITPGGNVARRITASGGNDTVVTGGGNDTILIRDGGPDTTVDCGGGPSDLLSYDAGDASLNCESPFEDAFIRIGDYPFEGETIAARTPAIPLLTSGKRTTSVVQCAFGATGTTPAWVTCPSNTAYTPAPSLVDGSYTLKLRLKNAAGVTVGDEQVRNFKVNGTVPDTSITSTPPNPSRGDDLTFLVKTLTGVGYECAIDTGQWVSCLDTKVVNGLTSGTHTFKVRAFGAGGAVDPEPATHTWTVDTSPPDTTLTGTPAEGATTEQTPANFTYTSTESPATFVCSVNGGAYAPCSSPDTRMLNLIGPYSLRVAAVDAAGNQDPTPAVRNLTIVAQPFATEITQAADFYAYYGPNKRPSYSFVATGTGGPFTFKCWTSDTAPAPCTSPWQAPVVSDGYTNVTIAAFNAQGVQDYTTAQEAFIGDVGLPDTALTSGPAEGAVIATDTGTAVATFGLSAPTETPAPGCSTDFIPSCATYQCKLDASPWAPCTSPYSTPALAVGAHALNVRAVDSAGNVDSTPTVRSWNIVAAPQTAFTAGPETGSMVTTATPSYSFAATPATGATFQCTYGPTTAPGTWVPCTSPWTIPAQANGSTVVVQVRAKNAAGYYDPTPDMRMVQFDLSTLLVATATATPSAVNLTAETGYGSALDWIHWKSSTPSNVDRMNATQRISTFSTIGTASTATLNGPTTFSWTNATGATAASSSIFGVARLATGTGFSFSVPASGTEVRRLRVHLGIRGVGTTARFAATLAGKPTVVQTISSSTAGFSNRTLMITYRPKTASDTLNVAYSQTAGGTSSGVSLNAASLH